MLVLVLAQADSNSALAARRIFMFMASPPWRSSLARGNEFALNWDVNVKQVNVRQFDAEYGMALHQASGRWKLGLAMALLTALSWATLLVALKITLEQIDPYTLTWFRFLVAAVVMV